MAKDSTYHGVIDEFRYLIETNEKYNHELLEDLNWMKKTAYQFKHQAQKSVIRKEDLKMREFKIQELQSEIKKRNIMYNSVNVTSYNQTAAGSPAIPASKNKFYHALKAAKRAD